MTGLRDSIVQLPALIAVKLVECLYKTVVVGHDRISCDQAERLELVQVLLKYLQHVLLDRCGQLLVELRLVEQGFELVFALTWRVELVRADRGIFLIILVLAALGLGALIFGLVDAAHHLPANILCG